MEKKDIKTTDNCIMCKKKLARNSKHHNKCHSCWVKYGKEHNIKFIKLKKITNQDSENF